MQEKHVQTDFVTPNESTVFEENGSYLAYYTYR